MLKSTPEWQRGRRGEILQLGALTRFGWALLDVGGSTNAKAPYLHQYEANFVSPDAMGFKSGPLWIEFKTKGRNADWRGGSAGDSPRIPARQEQGIERRNYEAYLQVQETTGIEVLLTVLVIDSGDLLAATLRQLGAPRMSPNRAYDIVNWDVSRFRRLCRFDRVRLRSYFYHPDGSVRDAPDDVPGEADLRHVLDWLRPQQGEFDPVMREIVNRWETEWRHSA